MAKIDKKIQENESEDSRVRALAIFTGKPSESIEDQGDNSYAIGDEEYLVLTDEEADEKLKEDIEQSIWAFNPDFIEGETGISGLAKLIKAASNECEKLNEPLLEIVEKTCGIDNFVQDADDADGRGHFLASYNDVENEVKVDGKIFYIYRTN